MALALAELHSRSGLALGITALDSALEVLRTRAGSYRLVMMISHLHAVAEAVDDVLWVQRTTAGASARWLISAERDELAQADLTRGLQAPAR